MVSQRAGNYTAAWSGLSASGAFVPHCISPEDTDLRSCNVVQHPSVDQ